MKNWKTIRKSLNLTKEDETAIAFEKNLINSVIDIREKEGISQIELAKKANVKQSQIARFEKAVHSPQINSILKILYPLGYTLKLEKIKKWLFYALVDKVIVNKDKIIVKWKDGTEGGRGLIFLCFK